MEELEDRWILGLRGIPVVAVSPGAERQNLVVTLADGTQISVRGSVPGSWKLTQGAASAPGATPLPAEVLETVVGSAVASAVAFTTGSLRVVFRTGLHLSVRGKDPGIDVRVHKPGDFDWSSRDGACVMKALGSRTP